MNPVECMKFHMIPVVGFYDNILRPLFSFLKCTPYGNGDPLRIHEDFVGNPLHMFFAGIAILLFLFRAPWIPRPARWSVLFVCLSWIFLHVAVRPSAFISRIQTPVFMLFPCFLAAWSPRSKVKLVRFFFAAVLIVSIMACLSYGFVVAVCNQTRPMTLTAFWKLDRDSSYYANIVKLKSTHDAVIEAVQQTHVRRVGLVIGEEYDYPLSWRLYRSGVEVRHVIKDSDLQWAEAIFAQTSRPPATKDWIVYGGNSSVLINPQFVKKTLGNYARNDVVEAIYRLSSQHPDGIRILRSSMWDIPLQGLDLYSRDFGPRIQMVTVSPWNTDAIGSRLSEELSDGKPLYLLFNSAFPNINDRIVIDRIRTGFNVQEVAHVAHQDASAGLKLWYLSKRSDKLSAEAIDNCPDICNPNNSMPIVMGEAICATRPRVAVVGAARLPVSRRANRCKWRNETLYI